MFSRVDDTEVGNVLVQIPFCIALGDRENAHCDQLKELLGYIMETEEVEEWFVPILSPLLCLLFARFEEAENIFWNPYIQMLPTEISSTLSFDILEMEYLQQSTRAIRLHNLTLQVVDVIIQELVITYHNNLLAIHILIYYFNRHSLVVWKSFVEMYHN